MHAGRANGLSLGVDVCQQPTLNWKARYQKPPYNYNVDVVSNPFRGNKKILTLDPVIAKTAEDFVKDLARAFNIPHRFPRDSAGKHLYETLSREKMESFNGILSHAHLSKRKWDIFCWMESIFGP